MNAQAKIIWGIVVAALVTVALIFLIEPHDHAHDSHDHHGEAAVSDAERGVHGGRLLREDDFALEITVFEDGVPPELHVYATDDDAPIPPKDIALTVTLKRLDGEVNTFRFAPVADYLRGNGVVHEPHSYDVTVAASYKGKSYTWTYASYEGRTTIPVQTAANSGVKTEQAGPGTIATAFSLSGRIVAAPDHTAQVRARFAGTIREVRKSMGDDVQAGDVLAVIESNESLQPFQLRAPIAGKVVHRAANIGETTADRVLFEIADTRAVVAELNVFPRQAGLVKEGQKLIVRALDGETSQNGTVDALATVADPATQSIEAHVRLDNTDGRWIPGMVITARVVTSERQAPLVVRNSALQTFRDFTVVFAKVGDTYEVRMLELGESDGTTTEVLGGLKPGAIYVTDNSYLIKADIEKSGASHDH